MFVEYAGIVAGISLLAATLTGAYGQNVTAVFAASGAGVAAVGKAAHVQHVSSSDAKAAYREGAVLEARTQVSVRARLDRRDEEPHAVRPDAARRGRREGSGRRRHP